MGLLARHAEFARVALARRPRDLDLYRAQLDVVVRRGDRVLHLGCGWDRSEVTAPLARRCEIIGVDLDATALTRFHGRAFRADAARLPFADASFDVACSEYVFEHVQDPEAVMGECARVLRPGGVLVALTPNRWSYKALAAALTPHAGHELAARWLRLDAREAADVYPTAYRMNTFGALHHLAAHHGLTVEELHFLNNGPTWFARIPGLFELGLAWHRALDLPALERLRCGILLVLRKRTPTSEAGAAVPQAGRIPLRLRCVACAATQEQATEQGWRCEVCGARLQQRAGYVDALGG